MKHNFSEVSVDDFVQSKISIKSDYLYPTCLFPILTVPIIGSIYGGYKINKFVNIFLSDILSELKQDAITVYIHFFKEGQPLVTDHLQNA